MDPILVTELGSGGMAEVFLAMRRGMGGFVKLVVVKRLRTNAMEGDAVAMFHDEARISARLNHPNVVQTHEVGFDGEHYRLEMEYLDGQPLHRIAHRAKRAGRGISHAVAVAVVQDVLAGLHYAHELQDYDGGALGIVHRDVSPQNIFVTYDGRVKLVDFGIAKASGQMAITQLGMVKGKIQYMAPEQATGQPVDARADVFATGVVLWQLLVGRRYWGDLDELAILQRMTSGKLPESPRTHEPAISEALDAVCARALAYHPRDRYSTAEEFHRALDACGFAERGARLSLGALAAELFADARAAIRAKIEEAAARPVGQPDDAPTKPVAAPGSIVAPPSSRSASDRPVSGAVRLPARGPRWPLLGVAVAIAAVLGAATATATMMSMSRSAVAPSSSPPASDVPHPASPASSAVSAGALTTTEPGGARPGDRSASGTPPFPSGEPLVVPSTHKPLRGEPLGQLQPHKTKVGAGEAATDVSVPASEAGAPPLPAKRRLSVDTADPWDAGVEH